MVEDKIIASAEKPDLELHKICVDYDFLLKNPNFLVDMSEEDKVILLSKANEVLDIKPLIKRKI